jgi:hypothetical protein
MKKEGVESISQLKYRNRWDGGEKYFTSQCPGCPSFKEFNDGEVCFGGVAWKKLDRSKTRNYCQLQEEKTKNQCSGTEGISIIVIKPTLYELVTGKPDYESLGFKLRFIAES